MINVQTVSAEMSHNGTVCLISIVSTRLTRALILHLFIWLCSVLQV